MDRIIFIKHFILFNKNNNLEFYKLKTWNWISSTTMKRKREKNRRALDNLNELHESVSKSVMKPLTPSSNKQAQEVEIVGRKSCSAYCAGYAWASLINNFLAFSIHRCAKKSRFKNNSRGCQRGGTTATSVERSL